MLKIIGQAMLWIAVIAWSLWFGGLLYEVFVVMPLWSSALPESAIEWNSRPNFMLIPTQFYAPVAIMTILSSVVAAVLAWKASNNRIWAILSAVCAVVTLAFTFIFFFPKNEVLFYKQVTGLSGEEISAIANAWIRGNWIRVGIMAVGFIAALRAYKVGIIHQQISVNDDGVD